MMCDRSDLEVAASLDDEELDPHLADCAVCRATRDEFIHAITIARELPIDMPSSHERAQMRTSLIVRNAHDRARRPVEATPARTGSGRWIANGTKPTGETPARGEVAVRRSDRWLANGTTPPPIAQRAPRRFAPIAIATTTIAIAVAAMLIPDAPNETTSVTHSRGTVRPEVGARFTSTTAPDEIVRLEQGLITVDVAPLHPGERFRVVVGDAEIEVRGTSFTVSAERDRLLAVTVHHGLVDVRPRGRPIVSLGAGDQWRHAPLPERAAATPLEPKLADPPRRQLVTRANPSPSPTRVVPGADVPSAPKPERAPEELAYEDGWTAMRAGNFARAAAAFARVFLIAPDGSLAEDAAFWRAVALARGGRAGEATNAFRDFVVAHPRAKRFGEASAMLGWLLVDARAYAEAEQRFRAALSDPTPMVQTSAREGLAALRK